MRTIVRTHLIPLTILIALLACAAPVEMKFPSGQVEVLAKSSASETFIPLDQQKQIFVLRTFKSCARWRATTSVPSDPQILYRLKSLASQTDLFLKGDVLYGTQPEGVARCKLEPMEAAAVRLMALRPRGPRR